MATSQLILSQLHQIDPMREDAGHLQLSTPMLPKRCLFLEMLPGDLRNIIYEKVFYEPNGVHIDFNDKSAGRNLQTRFALAVTCKEIRDECSGLLYWLNTFHLHVPLLQNTSRLRSTLPVVLPLRHLDPSTRRFLNTPTGDLISKSIQLRETAQRFVTMAMRLPHIDEKIDQLSRLVKNTVVISQIRHCHVHLGSQTDNAFVARFLSAWNQVAPVLADLRTKTELRVSFGLRVSKRLVVAYEFGLRDLETTMQDMDGCVIPDGDLTLPELSSINSVRSTVCHSIFTLQTTEKTE